jgi:precorrin-6B C5,15-methyltransferase / cobalt-precorrin-6B C5,C15-methyltransferase
MTPIQVVGTGLEGAASLAPAVRCLVDQATLLVGSARHLSYFPDHPADRLVLDDFTAAIATLQGYCADVGSTSPADAASPRCVVILVSGDPLFFGLGRLLLAKFSPEWLTFHPHLSSMQLAFSRVKLPWQDAELISAHGRSLEELTQALQRGADKIAVLTDPTNTPAAIAQLMQSLNLATAYRMWICENLGGADERTIAVQHAAELEGSFAALNVVVLQRRERTDPLDLRQLPLIGIADHLFLSFRDRPGLITKREVRVLALSELDLHPSQVIWDIGAGTGSVAIEMARLCPDADIYAIEKTSAGHALIQQNCQRFHVQNVNAIYGSAPTALKAIPSPDRVFIGGSGGDLVSILEICAEKLHPQGRIVLAFATLEHLATALQWLTIQQMHQPKWHHHLLQIQISRSTAIAGLTRFTPLNPVTLSVFMNQLP